MFTPFFFRWLYHRSTMVISWFIANLFTMGLLFAMRPGGCVLVRNREKNTKVITLGNTEFWSKENERTEIRYKQAFQSWGMSITFEDHFFLYNTNRKTKEATGDPLMCTKISGEYLDQNLLQSAGTTFDTDICTFLDNGWLWKTTYIYLLKKKDHQWQTLEIKR